MIAAAEGPVSTGVCKLCDETREFKNSIDTWDNGRPAPPPLPMAVQNLGSDEE